MSPLRLAIGGFAAPLAWALHLGAGYALADWVCVHDTRWLLYALTLTALLLAAAGILVSGRNGRRAAGESSPAAPLRFLGYGGQRLGLLFFVVIAVQSIPIALVERCL
ncbi:MAG TPA: hypothetical protein VIR60_05755 [Gammaproteobacteria bacterium]